MILFKSFAETTVVKRGVSRKITVIRIKILFFKILPPKNNYEKVPIHKPGTFLLYQILDAISIRKSAVLTCFLLPSVEIKQRSFVIMPSSTVSIQHFSTLWAKSESSAKPSSSPLFRSAPVHAKRVAIGFAVGSSPFKYL